ncbi:hypothetical protein [Nocardia sp. NPDC005978]|uniref:hypothetical protein n=1 Tax=unclassified Nocardia TaxID=2637762 RepID=UPI0033A913C2
MTESRTSGMRLRRTPRKHAGEGIEDGVNVLGILLFGLGIVAVGMALVAGGYGFGGWALVAGVAAAVLFVAGGVVLLLEWRRRHPRGGVNEPVRQGH